MEDIFAFAVAIGLSAACGFRVFVPPMILSGAALFGETDLPSRLLWLEDPFVFGVLAIAVFVEIAGYYIPWVDNALDMLAGPASIIAGTLISRAYIGGSDEFLYWVLAAIVGGGSAGSMQMLTTVTRLTSSATTGGLGNPVVSTTENAGAALMSILALAVPIIAAVSVIALIAFAVKRFIQFMNNRRQQSAAGSSSSGTPPRP